ncbi:hypothetical protein M0811_12165 [Anaeramoeba ignava]|uniref:Uncharacterized protein n=1 Tax=Anaeramoeba ignava TaxID=1746090 RepID=A0A9Q0R6C4_ANAIG|nr:hypothetical protein M0811_12165 [Anaeramoeba ignava]
MNKFHQFIENKDTNGLNDSLDSFENSKNEEYEKGLIYDLFEQIGFDLNWINENKYESEESFEIMSQLIYFFYHDKIHQTKFITENVKELEPIKEKFGLNPNSILSPFLDDSLSESFEK